MSRPQPEPFGPDVSVEHVRETVRAWLQEHLSGPFADVVGAGGSGREDEALERRLAWERHLGQHGWIGIGWPVEHGGRGATIAQQVAFYEEYARADGPGRLSHIGEQLVGPTLLAYGTPDQQTRFLPGILSAEQLWCQGYSEPGAGSDLAAVRTRAIRIADADGEHYEVSGQKVWTSLAHIAQWCFVLARTEPGSQRHHGLSYLLVPMDQPGIDVRPIVQITGTSEFNEVFFDGARVALADRVGDEGQGWEVAMATLGFERGVATLGQQLGFAHELDRVVAQARSSGAVQRPEVAARLLQAWMGLEVMRHTAIGSLRSAAEGTAGHEASLSKLQWARWHRDLGELAVDVEPEGLLVADDGSIDPAQSLFLFTRADTIYGGSDEIQRNVIAQRMLGLPRGPR